MPSAVSRHYSNWTTFHFLYCIYEPPTRPSPLASRSACYCSGRTGSDVEQRCSMLSPMSLFQNTVHRTLCLVLGCLALLFLILFNPFILNYDISFFLGGVVKEHSSTMNAGRIPAPRPFYRRILSPTKLQ